MPAIRRSAAHVTFDSTAGINEGGSDDMAEHRVRKNNIIYIIPNDDLFAKWKSNGAFIDEYGRLMNRRPHRVLKELKHYVDDTPMAQRGTVLPSVAPVRKGSPIMNHFKDTVRDRAIEAGKYFIDYVADKFFYEVMPNVWHEHIVPLYHQAKEALTTKELKVDAALSQTKASMPATTKQDVETKMTHEESDAEKRKVLYHWIGMLSSLKKLHDAGEIDIDSTLAQLTEPAMLKRVNGFLSENPNLLDTNKYIMLHGLLGRDLYEEQQLVPIRAAEITTIVVK